jgi:hypothetical protein
VSLLRALLAQPQALLLDEPFSRLDAARVRRSRVRLRHACAERRCAGTVLVTHDPADVPSGAARSSTPGSTRPPASTPAMLDRYSPMRALRPRCRRARARCARSGVGADTVRSRWPALASAWPGRRPLRCSLRMAGLALLLASRLCDGLDGALARLTRPTDRGAFLDITLDFLFYASVPLAFALADPAPTRWPRRCCWRPSSAPARASWPSRCWPSGAACPACAYPTGKGLYYLGGLTEATETLICFALMCLWPGTSRAGLRLCGAVRADHRHPLYAGRCGPAGAARCAALNRRTDPICMNRRKLIVVLLVARAGGGLLRLRPRALLQPRVRQSRARAKNSRRCTRSGRRW